MELKVIVTQKGKIFKGAGPDIVNKELTAAMYEATMFLERKVKEMTPIGAGGAKGGLRSTIYGEVVQKGQPVVKGVVASHSMYGEVIEKGRTAGKTWPPEGSLLRWIQVKGLTLGEKTSKNEARIIIRIPNRGEKEKDRKKREKKETSDAKRLEFLIRRKIGREGFPGAFMFEKGLEAGWPKLQEIFDRAGFKIAKQLNEE